MTDDPDLAGATSVSRSAFGRLADGRMIEAMELSDGRGLRARILTLGATLQRLETLDRSGNPADIVLGYAEPQAYLNETQYIGATVGRFANRLAGGAFTLDGRHFHVPKNDGDNALHGGAEGFDKRVWTIETLEQAPYPRAVLSYVSPDGEQGFPGNLRVEASFALPGDGVLAVEYRAVTDQTTIVTVTNHSYFNLGGEACGRDVMDHRLTLHAQAFAPVDTGLIPTGEHRPVADSPFDFRTATPIGARIREGGDPQLRFGRGYDHHFLVDGGDADRRQLRPVAKIEDPVSGRVLEVASNMPGVQFYSGNALDGSLVGKGGRAYRQGDAFALEPQIFPDAPNQPGAPSARLDPGVVWINRTQYRFSTSAR